MVKKSIKIFGLVEKKAKVWKGNCVGTLSPGAPAKKAVVGSYPATRARYQELVAAAQHVNNTTPSIDGSPLL